MEPRLWLFIVLLPSISCPAGIQAPSATTTSTTNLNVTSRLLSRRKRYLTFPEGSTFSFAFCMELKTLTADIDIFSEGVAVAANYDLPSKPELLFTVKPRPPTPVLQRRHRRDLYARVENVFNLAGLDGRSCVLRALCEAAQQFVPRVGMLEEILRTIFLVPVDGMRLEEPKEHWQYRVPVDGMRPEEPKEHWQYRTAFRSGTQNLNCQPLYPRCPLSLMSVLMTLEPANLFYK